MSKFFCLMLVLLSFAGVFAQEKTITESEFNAIYDKAKEKRESNPYRMTTTFKNTVEGKPESANSGTVVMESVSPTMSRIVLKTNFESESKERERVKVNDKIYTREDGAAWKQESTENRTPVNRTSGENTNAEYKFIGSEMLNGQKAAVYQKTESRKRIRERDKAEINSDINTKYWFGENGDLMKVERTATVHIGDEIIHSSFNRTFEFDPNIKIETPKIAGSEK